MKLNPTGNSLIYGAAPPPPPKTYMEVSRADVASKPCFYRSAVSSRMVIGLNYKAEPEVHDLKVLQDQNPTPWDLASIS